MERQCELSNSAISNDLERPVTQISRLLRKFLRYSTSNSVRNGRDAILVALTHALLKHVISNDLE